MNTMDALDNVPSARRAISITDAMINGDTVEVRITDYGMGIPASQEQRVFRPFFTTKTCGLGLGLSICGSILKVHGRTLSLQNNVKEGATAVLRLPALTRVR